MNLSVLLGGVLCVSAVAFGAFGAHALAELLTQNQRIDTYELANRYHFYHGLALLALGGLPWRDNAPGKLVVFPLFVGTLIFSGSLYLLALTNFTWLGAVTPLGGVALLFGWAVLVYQSCSGQSQHRID